MFSWTISKCSFLSKALVDFANLITKKVSLLVCGHVVPVKKIKSFSTRRMTSRFFPENGEKIREFIIVLLFFPHQNNVPMNIPALKDNVNLWLRDHKVRAFYSVSQATSFEEGARNAITMAGFGKFSPNMLLLGFKSDWKEGSDKVFHKKIETT